MKDLLNVVAGALGSQAGGGRGQNPQAAMIQAILGMLMQGGLGGGGAARAGAGGAGGAGLGGLGGLLGGLAQMAGGGAAQAGGSGGGLGAGLGGLLEQFSRAGMGDAARSWVGTGTNMPVSADQISRVFGNDLIGQLSSQLGMAPAEVAGQMSQLLPQVVDKLTPNGQVPQGNDLAALGNIDGLLKGLLR